WARGWKAEMKKLQGTWAGRPIALAFDTGMLIQMGVKLFATDEAILSPDWVSNLALINAYDMRSGEFFFISRAYATHRKVYQQVLKEAKEFFDPNLDLLSKMALYTTRTPRAELRTREGEPAAGDQVVEGYTIQKVVAMTRTDACGQIELVTDANVATEVARREATARTKGVPFSMDKVIFHHPRLAGCISPVINRTKSQILGEKLEMATKLVFVPSATREKDEPLDLHSKVFVSHCGVFLDIGQFAVYVAKFIKPKGRPTGRFAYLMLRHRYARPHHEQFEPNLGKPARGGPYGKDQGGKGQQKRCFIAKESLGGHVQVGTTEVKRVSEIVLFCGISSGLPDTMVWWDGFEVINGLEVYRCFIAKESLGGHVQVGTTEVCFGLKELHLGGHVTLGIFEVQRCFNVKDLHPGVYVRLRTNRALSRFANQQTVVVVVLAKNEETTWRPPTVVLRCATANGEEFELHMVAQALGQGQKMSIGASFSTVVDSGGIKPYRASERLRGCPLVNTLNGTGIVAAPYIRTAGEVKLTKTITAVQNVVGIVVCMGELVKTSNQLPKRLVSLQFADYEFGIEFVGAIASCPPRKLKTMTVPKMEGEERPSKALKCDIPEVTVATLDSAPEGTAVFLVGKLRAVTPQDVVVNVISFSANSMKFAAEIEADNAQARVDWWSNEAGFKELFGEGVPWTDLWERCETQAFAARAWASLSVHVSGKVFGSGQCMPQRRQLAKWAGEPRESVDSLQRRVGHIFSCLPGGAQHIEELGLSKA
ncbi:unnamed protein product, partial [Cladocopium goreaui]